MKKVCQLLVVWFCVLLAAGSSTLAQSEGPNRKELLEAVFEPELFGAHLQYLMGIGTNALFVSTDCSDSSLLPPGTVCVQAGPGGYLNQADLGHVTLPSNSVKSGIMFVGTSFIHGSLTNHTDSQLDPVEFTVMPQIDLESDALKDPRAVDADGNPLNGVLESISIAPRCQIRKSMAPHERFEQTCWGSSRVVVLSKSALTNGFLPADIVDRMFRGPITIRLRLTGRLLHSGGDLTFHVRAFGL